MCCSLWPPFHENANIVCLIKHCPLFSHIVKSVRGHSKTVIYEPTIRLCRRGWAILTLPSKQHRWNMMEIMRNSLVCGAGAFPLSHDAHSWIRSTLELIWWMDNVVINAGVKHLAWVEMTFNPHSPAHSLVWCLCAEAPGHAGSECLPPRPERSGVSPLVINQPDRERGDGEVGLSVPNHLCHHKC
jgi:hypothetical protein